MKVTVYGDPGTQGSHKIGRGGKIIHDSAKTIPWREAVKTAVMLKYPIGARGTDPILHRGPVGAIVAFSLGRPKKAKPHDWPATRPDIDKLIRSTLDALTEMGVFEDDGRVVSLGVLKQYCGTPRALDLPGATIEVFSL